MLFCGCIYTSMLCYQLVHAVIETVPHIKYSHIKTIDLSALSQTLYLLLQYSQIQLSICLLSHRYCTSYYSTVTSNYQLVYLVIDTVPHITVPSHPTINVSTQSCILYLLLQYSHIQLSTCLLSHAYCTSYYSTVTSNYQLDYSVMHTVPPITVQSYPTINCSVVNTLCSIYFNILLGTMQSNISEQNRVTHL